MSREILKFVAPPRERLPPKDIRVIRHELQDDAELACFQAKSAADTRVHDLRNQVNRAMLKLQLAGKYFAAGRTEKGLVNMSEGMAELGAIDQDLTQQQKKPAGKFSLAEAKATFTIDNPKARRVLLVDDDANERTLMASYLKQCGLEVEEATDGLKALYALTKPTLPDVVLMDMNMPNLDGPETVKRIRQCSAHRSVPVFAVTGQPIEETGLSISDNGVTGWFQKPVQVDAIVEAIYGCVAV
ncbi:CheY-like chemotaxis protein [Rhodopirellula rubra]|uniref:CheY-like chemotaxis protein n=1 Tax=Aporhodopirellula rubra TaxID=980271 RepID=A0A7W5E6H9_9BACT|nr:CheY-like chemotaxis protein [Aporhodopirellula rubra]